MKAERGIYDCGHASATTARPSRLKNCYKSKSGSGIVFTIYQTWLVVAHTRRGFFFLAREFDGFPLAFFIPSRVQGKRKVTWFCIVFFIRKW